MREIVVGVMLVFLFSGCGSGAGSSASSPTQSNSQTLSGAAKTLMSSWTDPVSGKVLNLLENSGGIDTPNATIVYLDQSADSWEQISGNVWQSIQIGDSDQGNFVLGSPAPDLNCASCADPYILNGIVPWPENTYSYSLSNNVLHVCNSAGLCWDLE